MSKLNDKDPTLLKGPAKNETLGWFLSTFLRNSRRYGIRSVFFHRGNAQKMISDFASFLVDSGVIEEEEHGSIVETLLNELVDLRPCRQNHWEIIAGSAGGIKN